MSANKTHTPRNAANTNGWLKARVRPTTTAAPAAAIAPVSASQFTRLAAKAASALTKQNRSRNARLADWTSISSELTAARAEAATARKRIA